MAVDKITVLLVDDHAWVRGSVAQALSLSDSIEVVGQANNGEEGVKKAQELTPDVVVMDLDMPVMGGVEATRQIRAAVPSTQVLVLTVSESESDLFAAMAAGAKGYLLKNAGADDLQTAVVHISQGGVLVSPIMATTMLTQFTEAETTKAAKTETGLSPREEEVLQSVAQGASNKEVAATLFITENTVKTHLRSIMEKLHVVNRSQATAFAVRAGLYREPDRPTAS